MEHTNQGSLQPQERVLVFVDGAYLRNVEARLPVRRCANIPNLIKILAEPGLVVHTYYYDCEVKGSNDTLLAWLEHRGITVRRGHLQTEGGAHQKMVDTSLAVDATRCVNNQRHRVQSIILLTGDSDFVPVVKEAHANGVRVFIAHGQAHQTSRYLLELADGCIPIDAATVIKSNREETVEPPPKPVPPKSVLPKATRTIGAGDPKPSRVKPGEVAAVISGGSAIVENGGVAIAYADATIHALKGSTIYLCAKLKSLTGTSGFELVPVDEKQAEPVASPAKPATESAAPAAAMAPATPRVVPIEQGSPPLNRQAARAPRILPSLASPRVRASAPVAQPKPAPERNRRAEKRSFAGNERQLVIDWMAQCRMSEQESIAMLLLFRNPNWRKLTKTIRRFLSKPSTFSTGEVAQILNSGAPFKTELHDLIVSRQGKASPAQETPAKAVSA